MLQAPNKTTANLLKLADVIEKLPHIITGGQSKFGWEGDVSKIHGFSMSLVTQEVACCGTVCCIYGVARTMFGVTMHEDIGVEFKSKEYTDLFFPKGYSYAPTYTSKRAARVLRHLAITGEVDWSI